MHAESDSAPASSVPVRVLLCSSKSDDQYLAAAFLDEAAPGHYALGFTDSFERARSARVRGDHEVYLVDLSFGGGRGLELLAAGGLAAPPAVVLVPEAVEATEERALEAGADAVLVRHEIAPSTLERALRHALYRARARGWQAWTRVLAGLTTPAVLRRRLELALTRARLGVGSVALLVVHVDVPSPVEDLLPRVIAAAAERVSSCVRDADTVCATPEGFQILLEDLDQRFIAARIADRIVAELAQAYSLGQRQNVQARTSIGASIYPDSGDSVEDFYGGAALGLAAARAAGGNTFRFELDPLNERANRRIAVERALDRALERRELELYYQPQVDLETAALVGAEALLRWKHPTLGWVSPAEFVPILEESRAIFEVTGWVLRTACEQVQRWVAAPLAGIGAELRVSVNFSAKQFEHDDVAALVREALHASGLAAKHLTAELTESVMLSNTSRAKDALVALRAMGVHVAVDDFGTGYASLRYVRDFPMDAIKIDRGFVRGLPLNTENAAISSSILALAHSLGLKVVAEGVETEGEAEFLRSVGCQVSQGYLHGKPMPAAEFEAWAARRAVTPEQSAQAAAEAAGRARHWPKESIQINLPLR